MDADSGGERETMEGLAELAEVREGYGRWLGRQPLSANTKKAYAARAGRYLDWLAGTPTAEYGNPLGEAHARDYAARDFKSHLKTVGKAKPSSVDLSNPYGTFRLDMERRLDLDRGPADVPNGHETNP